MIDLIDRQAALRAVIWNSAAYNAINRIPSAKQDQNMIHLQKEQAYLQGFVDGRHHPVPQTPGHWLEIEVVDEPQGKHIEQWQSAKCSICGKYHTTPYMYYYSHYDYCPNCGNPMER